MRQILFVPPAPVLWARQQDLFTREGIELTTTQTTSSNEIGQGLAEGGWDLGIGVMDNVLAWNAQFGADLCIVAQLERHVDLRFVCRETMGSLRDVAREPIAVDATSNGFVLALYRALAGEGLDWRDCRFEEVGGVRQRFEALAAGKAHSSILIPPFDAMIAECGFKVLWRREDVCPDYPGVVVAVRRAFLAQHREAVVRYLRILLRANRWATRAEQRDAAIAALTAARYTAPAAGDLVSHPVVDLRPSRPGWSETIALRKESGLLPPSGTAFESAVDEGPLQDAIRLEARDGVAAP